MEIWSLLAFGVLVGVQHALEADHLAAVAALSARRTTRRGALLRGACWGIGHTVALFAICGTALLLGLTVESRIEAALELCVGVMVALLGLGVLRSALVRRIHFHVHDHGDGTVHLHAHSHAGDPARHSSSPHHHRHPRQALPKALAVGLVHGAAGSGAVLVLVVAAANSWLVALAYIACFGLGSIAGMAALSVVVSFPLGAAARGAAWLNKAALAGIGAIAVVIGGDIIVESWGAIGL